jgi:DNA-binding HxlR family transcriptional regulator
MRKEARSIHYPNVMRAAKKPSPKINPPSATVISCPVERAIHVIGGKWKLLLLRSLLLNGPQGYNQLLASVTGISSKELTRNLAELVVSGLIAREAGSSVRIAPYSLTESGKGLMPIFQSLLTWGQTLLPTA